MTFLNFIKSIFATIATFFAPIALILVSLLSVILLDTVTGVIRARKMGEKITSRKLSATITKILLYHSTVGVVYIFDRALIDDLLNPAFGVDYLITKAVAVTICFVEFKSIHENIEMISEVHLYNAFKDILTRGKNFKKDIKDLK